VLKNLKLTEYFEKTASGDATPGGGSVAAMSAAAAASLVEMVVNLTIGKKGYEAVEAAMKEIGRAATALREKCIQAIDKDPEAYNQVMAAYKMPKSAEAEKQRRSQAIQEGLKNAARVPMEVAENALKIIDLAAGAIEKGNKNAATDGAVAAMTARTALLGAVYNVKINLSAITDSDFVQTLSQKAQTLESQVEDKERRILAAVAL
jgi:formiminotetrahydrofolate cyclodeaminase